MDFFAVQQNKLNQIKGIKYWYGEKRISKLFSFTLCFHVHAKYFSFFKSVGISHLLQPPTHLSLYLRINIRSLKLCSALHCTFTFTFNYSHHEEPLKWNAQGTEENFKSKVSLSIKCYHHFQEYERAVIFRLGRLLTGGARGPGVFFVIPCVDVYEKIDMRSQTFEIPPQEVKSKYKSAFTLTEIIFHFSHVMCYW